MKTSVTKNDINNVIAILKHSGAAMILDTDIKKTAARYADGTELNADDLYKKVKKTIIKLYN